jgi:hypothetical protein
VRAIGKFAIVIAWALLALVVSAALDKFPDDPAVLKQLSLRDAVGDHHVRAVACDIPVAATTITYLAAYFPHSVLVADVPPPAARPRSLLSAADASPPFLRT